MMRLAMWNLRKRRAKPTSQKKPDEIRAGYFKTVDHQYHHRLGAGKLLNTHQLDRKSEFISDMLEEVTYPMSGGADSGQGKSFGSSGKQNIFDIPWKDVFGKDS